MGGRGAHLYNIKSVVLLLVFYLDTTELSVVETCALPILNSIQAEDGIRDSEVTGVQDRKSTRLNSSHLRISYAVFCLRSEEHTSELQSPQHLVCSLLLDIRSAHV